MRSWRYLTALGVIGASAVAPALSAGPAFAAVDQPDLVVNAEFDKSSYVAGEAATVTFTMRNAGSATATNVHVSGGDAQGFDLDLTNLPTLGFDLAPGEERELDYPGTVNDAGERQGFASFGLGFDGDEDDANPEDNIAVDRVVVTGGTGDLAGIVFHEADGDQGTVDDEGVAGVRIALINEITGVQAAVAVTDANGEFQLNDIPTGPYRFTVTLPPGWRLGGFHETNGALVTSDENPRVEISVVPAPIAPTTAPPGPGLPVTGFSASLVAGVGVGVIALGIALVLIGRWRRRTSG